MLLYDGSDWKIAFRRLLLPKGDDALQKNSEGRENELHICTVWYMHIQN